MIQMPAQDRALVDTSAVARLEQRVGTRRCQELVEETIYEITDKLAKMERAVKAERFDDARDLARGLIGACTRIGLIRMSLVATDLTEVIALDDRPAIGAIAARLVRLGEDSLFTLVRIGGDGV
ncbi:hypothetical protein [Roseobacter sp. HKCCA0434]|uniref:hypothetical protein n=1 Tax=Roseobacter sp. HKCCA0434 TaxID=3079297 RepID=UPI002905F1F3|nr:hypothetical protein [Roseobacter sp. HKCCA0434]